MTSMFSNEKLGMTNEMNEIYSTMKNSVFQKQTIKIICDFELDFKKFLETYPKNKSIKGFKKFLSEKL